MTPRTLPPDAAVIEQFLDTLRARKKAPGTVDHYASVLRRIKRTIDSDLLAASPVDLMAWQRSITPKSPGSIAGDIACIKGFYRWCVRPMRYIDYSPAEDLVAPQVPRGKPRPVPESDVMKAFVACADDELRIWLALMRYAGLRCCEIAWMCRDWIIQDGEPRIRVVGKRQKVRIVFVDQALLDMLRPWMTRQGRLFTRANGTPITPKQVSHHVAAHFDQLDLPYTAHQLRHSFGTRSLDECEDLRVVQEMMGHSDPRTTALYTEPNQAKARRVAAANGLALRKLRHTA